MNFLKRWGESLWDNRPHELVVLVWSVAFGAAVYVTVATWPEMASVASGYLP